MSVPDPALAGFHSADGKRSVTRLAWIGGVVIGLLQFVLPAVLVVWALVHSVIGAFSTPQPEVEAPTADAEFVWYTAPVPSDDVFFETTRSLLRIPRNQAGKPAAVATFEGDTRDPQLVARAGAVVVVAENTVATFAQGQITSRSVDASLPRQSWPVAFGDATAVVVLERDHEAGPEVHTVSLWAFDGTRWETQWSESTAVSWAPDELRAVALNDGVHVFASDGDARVHHAVRSPSGLGPWQDTPVEALDWSAAALGGRPALVALEETEVTTFVRGWRLGDSWNPLFREEAESANAVGAMTLPPADGDAAGERLGVLTDELLDAVSLLEVTAQGEVVGRREYSSSTVLDEAIGMVVLSQLAPFLLTFGFALVLTASMTRHRVAIFEQEGRTIRYASVFKRGVAKAIDSSLALVVPAAILAPEIMGGQIDETRIWVVCLLWTVPLGLGITAWEGARGWTPGKRLLGIRVVGLDLNPPGFGAAFLRGLMGVADGFFSYMVGIVIVALNVRWQRMGDQVAHTLVIEHERPR